MTRFARGGLANKKKPNDASSWQELKKSQSSAAMAAAKSKGSANANASGSTLHRTDFKSGNFKKKKKTGKVMKKIVHSASTYRDTESAAANVHHVPTNIIKNKEKLSKIKREETVKQGQGHSINQQYYTETVQNSNSNSLIEELEEMDRKQMAEIQKDLTQKLDKTDPTEETKQLGKSMESLDKKERRREERRLKRQKAKINKMVCFHCREGGHGVADCPRALNDAEQGTGVCYRCGSTEHDSSQCTARIDPNQGEFPFAKCFICQEMGHLSRSCPDNPKGLYPMGGCCKFCESVEHMSWNCPDNKKVKGVKEVHLSRYSSTSHQSADAEVFNAPKRPATTKKKQPKIVKF